MGNVKSIGRLKRILKIDEGKLDIYLRYYNQEVDTADLNGTQLNMLEKYRKAWSWYCMGRTEDMVRAMLMKDYNIEERQARYVFEEAKFIHGKLDQVDRDGRRSASIAFYDLIANMALKEKNLEAAVKARERGDDLARLNEPEDIGLDPNDFMKASKFIFVNNVNVYKKQLDLDE
ncbi:hypothetical protein [Arundinibacter roseus]|uniref:Uncharacterized protein n=1 Tax=Arundinibacter roseus TaxID=2070510 RepID=A0A4R4KGE8_9BACT|nr:hypothetical protein [Arundinibacter roseus]TDB67124.1 hypothetical protein EZE20_08400 [Arundinibacter roseus]